MSVIVQLRAGLFGWGGCVLSCKARILAVCCAVLAMDVPAAEAKRVALVIGNAAYKVGPLQNPVNDASAVAAAFKRLGFDKVILRQNVGVNDFRAVLAEMARESAGADLGVVYFAGHGTEVAGRNFLIPVDATLSRASALDLEAVPLDTVLGQLDGVRQLKLVILDACRNNPFSPAGAKRAVSRGLARIEPEGNSMVVYAAKDGTTADDGIGQRHSPFTAALLKHVDTPGLEISLLFRRVRDDVIRATSHVAEPQQPHVYASLGGQELYLSPSSAAAAPAAPAAPSSPVEVMQVCESVGKNTSLSVVQSLLDVYRGTPMAPCIEARIEELRKQQAALTAPAPKPVDPAKQPEKKALTYADGIKCCVDGLVRLTAGSSSRAELEQICRQGPEASSPTAWKNWCEVLRIDRAMDQLDKRQRPRQ
jgi:caspase domain-containing protein